VGATVKLADRWFLGANVAVAWGEIRSSDPSSRDDPAGVVGVQPAFFTRSDATLRYLLSDTVSVFAGYKVQLLTAPQLHDVFFHGPVLGLTARFNIQ
jgi:hypothetical protein